VAAAACIGLLFVLGIVVYSVSFFGHVKGEEFSPATFTRREFSYYEIPLLGLQISPIHRRDLTNVLESHLTRDKLVTAQAVTESGKRWDLVIARRGLEGARGRALAQGNARILCEYLDALDSKSVHVWLTWTTENPELAKVVWPVVAQVARQDLYIFVPDLFELARNAGDPVELKAELDRWLVQQYLAFALTQQQLNRHEAAIELYSAVLQLDPSHADALIGRAKSLTALGNDDQASDDLAKAERPGAS
jgi:tetratricopeptide (TPR) repeat protein